MIPNVALSRSHHALAATTAALTDYQAQKGLDGRNLVIRGRSRDTHLEYTTLTIIERVLRFFGFGNASPGAISSELKTAGKWQPDLIQQINITNRGICGFGSASTYVEVQKVAVSCLGCLDASKPREASQIEESHTLLKNALKDEYASWELCQLAEQMGILKALDLFDAYVPVSESERTSLTTAYLSLATQQGHLNCSEVLLRCIKGAERIITPACSLIALDSFCYLLCNSDLLEGEASEVVDSLFSAMKKIQTRDKEDGTTEKLMVVYQTISIHAKAGGFSTRRYAIWELKNLEVGNDRLTKSKCSFVLELAEYFAFSIPQDNQTEKQQLSELAIETLKAVIKIYSDLPSCQFSDGASLLFDALANIAAKLLEGEHFEGYALELLKHLENQRDLFREHYAQLNRIAGLLMCHPMQSVQNEAKRLFQQFQLSASK